ncbi:MAG: porin [Pirellulaceae bacterium]|nr:hypothetical protein [Planctomycetales bacterium]
MRPILAFVVAALVGVILGSVSQGEDASHAADLNRLQDRLDAQAVELEELRGLLEARDSIYGPVDRKGEGNCGPRLWRLPVVAEECRPTCEDKSDVPKFHAVDYYPDYDGGIVIAPFCPERNPFELRVNGWTQLRHHGFARDVNSWTDNAGVTRAVRSRNAFDIERARLVLSGFAVDPRLKYFVHLDGDTDGGHAVDFFDYWWGWEFNDRFQLQMGKRKVPGSRQWLLTARRTRFVDRPMANDFFRPDRTVGLFGVGRIGENGHYEVMVGNGYNTANIPNSGTDKRLTFAIDNYFDPLGDYGSHIVDYEGTCDPLVRLGHSFVFSPNAADVPGTPLSETDFIRLTDGTPLTDPGALAPGITFSDFNVFFYGLDAAVKWRGWSINSEVFLRWIEELRGDGSLPFNDLFQRGSYVEAGRFLIPRRLDTNFRYSHVNGLFGDASEFAVGFNWYPLDTYKMKFSWDVTWLDGSPLNNNTSDILVGDQGTLFRTQFQAEF